MSPPLAPRAQAKIHDAVLFFDECESIFQDRTKGNMQVNTVLTELERHEGLCILATNRPMDLDEAMHRRITLAIEFNKPDLLLREKIWRSMAPPKLPLADDVDFMLLARKYELQGGFIKNAWLSALSIAVARDGLAPTVTMEDLHSGASHQLRGRLSMAQFDRGIVPQHGLEEVVLPSDIKEKLKQIVNYSKAQAVLFGQWGFQQQHGRAQGISALFHGVPGTGKTMAAEAIGFDVGRPLMVVNCAQLMDKYVGESAKNIEKVFTEAKGYRALLERPGGASLDERPPPPLLSSRPHLPACVHPAGRTRCSSLTRRRASSRRAPTRAARPLATTR